MDAMKGKIDLYFYYESPGPSIADRADIANRAHFKSITLCKSIARVKVLPCVKVLPRVKGERRQQRLNDQ